MQWYLWVPHLVMIGINMAPLFLFRTFSPRIFSEPDGIPVYSGLMHILIAHPDELLKQVTMMRRIIFLLAISVLSIIFLTSSGIADSPVPAELSVLSLEGSDLPAGYVIDQPFTPIVDDSECTGDFCIQNGGSFSASGIGEAGNISIDQEVLMYSQPVTRSRLIKAFTETYPELSTWNLVSLDPPLVGDDRIGFRYTVPSNIGPKNPPLTGYVVVFGAGNVYEVLKSTGGFFEDLTGVAKIAGDKLKNADLTGTTGFTTSQGN